MSDYNKPHLSHRSSDGNSTSTHQSETASMDATPTPPSRNTSFPVKEDCWSEDATFTLIESWGDKFVKLNRGNLRQKHWQEVADDVNARHGHVKKSRRTNVQCKNRIDTLKKKYKVEKYKILELGVDNYVSQWPFFAPLDSLIGSNFKPYAQTPTPQPSQLNRITAKQTPTLPPPPSSVPVGRRSKRLAPRLHQPSSDSSFFRLNFSVIAAAAAAASVEGAEDDSEDTSCSSGGNGNMNLRRLLRAEEEGESGGDPYHELAAEIGKFAEVYERVEEAKQRQMVELEIQRMQFTKDLEFQRMKLLMESQVQLAQLKRLKKNSEPHFCGSDEDNHSASIS